ncbi:MAG: DUF2029 domain-containing protein [Planctomycetaceae bacterium]|nr:DUF2029 domain-containing protein [Planctomycetaceae bacterium]
MSNFAELASKHGRRIVIGVALAILLVEAYIAIFRRENDFVFHRQLGGQFLLGTPYALGGDWYPLPRVMINALIAAPPNYVARGLSYFGAVLLLLWSARSWQRWASETHALASGQSFAAFCAAGVVLLPYLLRDLDECGLQLFLLFFLTAGGWALHRGRSIQAGFWLATAAVYKVVPLVCLPYLLWKRRFTAAAATVAWIGVWLVAPAAWLGWDATLSAHQAFLARSQVTAAHRSAYPEVIGIEPPKVQNQSLQAALARYFVSVPKGHPLHVEHPLFAQFCDLPDETAYRLLRGLMLALALALAWKFRGSWTATEASGAQPTEWATICLFCALAGPVCWKQHLVVAAPLVLLVARGAVAGDRRSRLRWGVLIGAGLAIVLTRHGIVGREAAIALMSYKIDVFALLALLATAIMTPADRIQPTLRIVRGDETIEPMQRVETTGRRAA